MYSASAAGQAVAQVWHAPLSLVVPVSYRRFAQPPTVAPCCCANPAAGLYRKGAGIINLSLAYPTDRAFGDAAEDVCRHLCGILTDRLSRLGIATGWPAYETALKAAGKTYQGYVYPGVNHGFHNDSTPRYNRAAAELAWQRTLDWFRHYLV